MRALLLRLFYTPCLLLLGPLMGARTDGAIVPFTPTLISINIGAISVVASFGILDLHSVPDPNTLLLLLLLLSASVVGVVVLGRSGMLTSLGQRMWKCVFCGQPTGWFHRRHPECLQRHDRAMVEIRHLASEAVTGQSSADSLRARADALAKEGFISPAELRSSCVQEWESAVDRILDRGVPSADEENALVSFARSLSLSEHDLDTHGAHSRLVKAAVIRDLLDGKVPKRFKVVGQLPFNFQKGEDLVWVFGNVGYIEQKTRTEYLGRSAGMSIRIARGVYYRVGAFRGQPVKHTYSEQTDRGTLGVTTKSVYFSGARNSLRIRHQKIVSFTQYSDGIGIWRESGKPIIFVTGDGWFTYNLLSNISRIAA